MPTSPSTTSGARVTDVFRFIPQKQYHISYGASSEEGPRREEGAVVSRQPSIDGYVEAPAV